MSYTAESTAMTNGLAFSVNTEKRTSDMYLKASSDIAVDHPDLQFELDAFDSFLEKRGDVPFGLLRTAEHTKLRPRTLARLLRLYESHGAIVLSARRMCPIHHAPLAEGDEHGLWQCDLCGHDGYEPFECELADVYSLNESLAHGSAEKAALPRPRKTPLNGSLVSRYPGQLAQDTLITVLFLAANPSDSTRLCLDEEQREIDLALRSSEHRNRFDLRSHGAVRPSDLQHLLLRHRPTIVHFGGHGSSDSEILLQDDYGVAAPVRPDALSKLFQVLRDNIRCVILNACYSESQAVVISDHIDCVIGMSSLISDRTAIRFASSFYQALGFGRDVKTAFDLGCNEVALAGIPEEDSPRLIANRVDPSLLRLVP